MYVFVCRIGLRLDCKYVTLHSMKTIGKLGMKWIYFFLNEKLKKNASCVLGFVM